MIINLAVLKSDVERYKDWILHKITTYDKITIGGIFIGCFALVFFIGNITANNSMIDLIIGPLFALLWTFPFISIPWIYEQTNIKNFRNIKRSDIRMLVQTRLFEQFIFVGCYELYFMLLALIGNSLHQEKILYYELFIRSIIIFVSMIGFQWFILNVYTHMQLKSTNYLKFTYLELIPAKKPSFISAEEYHEINTNLRRTYGINGLAYEVVAFFLMIFSVAYCLPVTTYFLIINNGTRPVSSPALSVPIIHYVPYLFVFLNIFFLVVSLIYWYKLPHTIQTIPEDQYTIPAKYVNILINLDPKNPKIIADLQLNNNPNGNTGHSDPLHYV